MFQVLEIIFMKGNRIMQEIPVFDKQVQYTTCPTAEAFSVTSRSMIDIFGQKGPAV